MHRQIKFIYATLIITVIGGGFSYYFVNNTNNYIGNNSTSNFSYIKKVTSLEKAEKYMDAECTRSKIEPVVNKSVFPNSTFNLDTYMAGSDGNNALYLVSGVESFTLSNGDKVTIHNQGCESYALVFNFETSHFDGNASDLKYGFNSVVVLMNQVSPGINKDIPLDIDQGIKYLSNLVDSQNKKVQEPLELNNYMKYSGDEIAETIAVTNISKLLNGHYSVEVVFAIGSL